MRAGDAFALAVAGLGGGIGLLLILGSKGLTPSLPFEIPRPWERPGPEPSPGETPAPVTRPPRPTPAPTPTVDPDVYKEHVGALKEFGKQEIGDSYLLNFGFIDYQGKSHRVSCQVARAAHAHELDGFGYDERDVERALQSYLDDELRRRDLVGVVQAKASGNGGWSYESHMPPGLELAEMERKLADIQSFIKIFDDEFPRRCRLLFKERGFLFGKYIEIDYAAIVRKSTPILRNCFDALEASGLGYNERQYLGLFVAFLQEIPYQVPPDKVGRRETNGFWVPPEVLVGNHGDCDSKSATFAALWRNFVSSVMLVEIPDHMMVGVEVRPRAGEKYVLVKNRYYVLGEVAGPGKRRPGDVSHDRWQQVSGHFGYTMVGSSP
jgi:hypothetical protein